MDLRACESSLPLTRTHLCKAELSFVIDGLSGLSVDEPFHGSSSSRIEGSADYSPTPRCPALKQHKNASWPQRIRFEYVLLFHACKARACDVAYVRFTLCQVHSL